MGWSKMACVRSAGNIPAADQGPMAEPRSAGENWIIYYERRRYGQDSKNLFVVLIVLLLVFLVGKNIIVKVAVEQGVRAVTGLSLKMQSLDISLSKTYVRIAGLQLFNPAGFPEKIMVDLPEIYVVMTCRPCLRNRFTLMRSASICSSLMWCRIRTNGSTWTP